MLRVMIVDDEEIIRNGIAAKIRKLFSDVEVVGKAVDAIEAIEMVSVSKPELIITDIRMPEMDGLEFIEKVKEIDEDIEFVIVSGYQEFEYARKAIELHVEEYLLKPIQNKNLQNIIQRIQKKVEEKKNRKQYEIQLKNYKKNYIEYIKNKYLTDFITYTGSEDFSYLTSMLQTVNIQLPYSNFHVICVLIKNIHGVSEFESLKDQALIKFTVMNIAEEILSKLGNAVVFENYKNQKEICIILNSREKKGFLDHMKSSCEKLYEQLTKVLKVDVRIGVSKNYQSLEHLNYAYLEAHMAIMQNIILEDPTITWFEEFDINNRITFFVSEKDKISLFSALSSNDEEEAIRIVNCIFRAVKEKNLNYDNLQTVWMDLVIILSKIVSEVGLYWKDIFKEDYLLEDYFNQYSSIQEIEEYFRQKIQIICKAISELKKSDGRRVINDIKEYIERYYYTDIGLNQLSNKYYMNANYLSQLFKQETEVGFTEYITQVRLKKARDLLTNTKMKSYEIAQIVGYSDPRYFGKVFAKHYGVTPSQFREKSVGNTIVNR